jgi:catechol 2,3-dioxygenase-like lactoylglutathione lyase family enzyme
MLETWFARGTVLALIAAVGSISGLAAGSAPRTASETASSPTLATSSSGAAVAGVAAVAMTVSDMERAVAFYTHVLDFRLESVSEAAGEGYGQLFGLPKVRLRLVRLRLGGEHLELMQFLEPRGRPIPADLRANDRAFQHIAVIVSDMNAAYARLNRFKVEHASTGPQRLPDWNPNAGGIQAFYFRDPDGHYLEILAFPPGKGAAKWHAPGKGLFLGIDHSAIVVSDTDQSLRFYRDVLGLHVTGESDNYGPEQEHLNNVSGAHLRITSLRAGAGPGVELLEYLAPRTGRATPANTVADDLWYWHIRMESNEPAMSRFAAGHAPQLSSEIATTPDGALGFHRGVILRDPDGHASLIAR